MAYRLAGTTPYVKFAIAPFSGYQFGPCTFAILMKRNVLSTDDWVMYIESSGGSGRIYLHPFSDNSLQLNRGGSDSTTGSGVVASTSLWYLLVATTSGGSNIARFHVYDGTSWTHSNGSGGAANTPSLPGTDLMYVGAPYAGIAVAIDVVCAGIKKSDRTDLQVETLSSTSFATWTGFGFDWLAGFDTSLESGGKLQDQATPGTGDEVTRTGTITTGVTDPPGWSWSGGGGAAPTSGFLGFM
jgi:hypothetical protein